MKAIRPSRGEVWVADLDPTVGREQGGRRPVLIVSANTLNFGPADLVFVLPITTKPKRVRSHVEVDPPEGGLREHSIIKCEDIRSIAKERLSEQWGAISSSTLAAVEDRLRILLDL